MDEMQALSLLGSGPAGRFVGGVGRFVRLYGGINPCSAIVLSVPLSSQCTQEDRTSKNGEAGLISSLFLSAGLGTMAPRTVVGTEGEGCNIIGGLEGQIER